MGKIYDNIFLLQPTSPLRDENDIKGAYDLFIKKKASFVLSVCEVDHSPIWCNTIPNDLSLNNFQKKEFAGVPRQLLPVFYRINGAIYIINRNYLFSKNDNNYLEHNSFAYIMDKKKSIDIDDEFDFKIAEYMINNN